MTNQPMEEEAKYIIAGVLALIMILSFLACFAYIAYDLNKKYPLDIEKPQFICITRFSIDRRLGTDPVYASYEEAAKYAGGNVIKPHHHCHEVKNIKDIKI